MLDGWQLAAAPLIHHPYSARDGFSASDKSVSAQWQGLLILPHAFSQLFVYKNEDDKLILYSEEVHSFGQLLIIGAFADISWARADRQQLLPELNLTNLMSGYVLSCVFTSEMSWIYFFKYMTYQN